MSRKMPQFTVATLVRGATTDYVEGVYEEFLAVTELDDFFFRIHVDHISEGDEYFVIGVLIRGPKPPAKTIDFPSWIRIF